MSEAINWPETLFVEVCREDIESGLKMDCGACPVARAVSRALHKEVELEWIWIAAAYDQISVGVRGLEVEYKTPPAVTEFMRGFDNGRDVEPFSFTTRLRVGS